MKKPLIFVLTLIFILSLGTKSFADGIEVSFAEKAGITPESIFYPLDVALDNVKIFLTIGEKNKINVIVDVAEERLGESEVMLEKGEQDKVQELVQEYDAKIQEAYEKLEKITEESITDDTENDLNDQMDEIEIDEADIDEEASEDEADTEETDEDEQKEETIEERFRLRQENSIGVLIRVKDSLPEQERERIQKVIEMQTAKKEAVANMVQARHQCNRAKQELKRAQIRLKKAVKSGDEEQVREAQEIVTQKKVVEEQAKKELSMAIAKKKEAVKIKVGNGKGREEKDKAIDEEEDESNQDLDQNKDEDEDDDIREEQPTEKADDEKVESKAHAKEAIKKVNKVKGNKKVKSNNGKALGRKKQ